MIHNNISDNRAHIVDLWMRFDPRTNNSTIEEAWAFIADSTKRGFPVYATVLLKPINKGEPSIVETFKVDSYGWETHRTSSKVSPCIHVSNARDGHLTTVYRYAPIPLEDVLTLISLGEIPF